MEHFDVVAEQSKGDLGESGFVIAKIKLSIVYKRFAVLKPLVAVQTYDIPELL